MRAVTGAFLGALLLSACASAPEPSKWELIVGEKIASRVGIYKDDGTLIASIPVGTHPHEFAVSPDGQLVYVSDNGILWMTEAGEGGNTISIIDPRKRQKVGVIDLGEYRRPHGMDIDPRTDRMVVTIENPDGLLLLDLNERKVLRKYDTQGKSPHMVKLNAGATVAYVSNTHSDTVAAIELETGATKLIPSTGRPQGATLSLDGTLLYMTESDGASILILDTGTHEPVGRIATGKGPGRIEITPDGKTLVYNLQEGEGIGFADVESRKEIATVSLAGPPLSMRLTPDAELALLGIQSKDKIAVVSVKERRLLRYLDTPPESGPDSVLAYQP